jgi:hypothetical protein
VEQREGPVLAQLGLFPPWQNTIIWLRQETQLAMLRLSGAKRKELRRALAKSGLGIRESKPTLGAYYEP